MHLILICLYTFDAYVFCLFAINALPAGVQYTPTVVHFVLQTDCASEVNKLTFDYTDNFNELIF